MVRKGLQTLVDEEIIYKKRGIGMFVIEGAKEKLLNEIYLATTRRRKAVGMSVDKVIELIKEDKK